MLKTENIINGFADVILFVIFQFLICAAYSAEYFSTPIDFGSATYQLSGGGFSNIAVTDAGVISTSGSGNLFNQTGGAAGNFAITNWETFEWRVILTVNEPGAGNYTITTPGCGSVTLNAIILDGGVTEYEENRHWESKTYVLNVPFGAALSLNYYDGNGACMITGSAHAAIHYVTKDGWITKSEGDLDVPIQLNITPLMTLEHNIAFFLNFGKICTSSLTQTITVSPSGSISSTNLYCGASGTSPDAFTVHGVTGASFVVNLPASASITNGENILTLSDFTSSCSSAPCSIESGFEQQFNVGATLTIPPGISLGHYVGSYMVSVTY